MNKIKILGIFSIIIGLIIGYLFDNKITPILTGAFTGMGVFWTITGKIRLKKDGR